MGAFRSHARRASRMPSTCKLYGANPETQRPQRKQNQENTERTDSSFRAVDLSVRSFSSVSSVFSGLRVDADYRGIVTMLLRAAAVRSRRFLVSGAGRRSRLFGRRDRGLGDISAGLVDEC